MTRSVAVLVGSAALLLAGALGGCGQDAAGGAPLPAPAPSSSTAPPEEDAAPAYPTLPAVVVRGGGEMPPPTDAQRQLLEDITTHGLPDATMAEVQRQDVLSPAFEELRAMPGWSWSRNGAEGDQDWDGSVAFVGAAPPEALELLRALPLDVRVVQGVLLTEDQRLAAQHAACPVVLDAPGVKTGTCGTDQESLLITIDYSGEEAADPPGLQARTLAAARAATDDPVAAAVVDVVVTHRNEPVAVTEGGDG